MSEGEDRGGDGDVFASDCFIHRYTVGAYCVSMLLLQCVRVAVTSAHGLNPPYFN